MNLVAGADLRHCQMAILAYSPQPYAHQPAHSPSGWHFAPAVTNPQRTFGEDHSKVRSHEMPCVWTRLRFFEGRGGCQCPVVSPGFRVRAPTIAQAMQSASVLGSLGASVAVLPL
jgi:hypothetical protein